MKPTETRDRRKGVTALEQHVVQSWVKKWSFSGSFVCVICPQGFDVLCCFGNVSPMVTAVTVF